MVPAYDDETVWKGHSSMVQEIKRQIPQRPDVIFCSVGGGGLLGGIIKGCRDVDWDDGDGFFSKIKLTAPADSRF